MTHTQAAGYVGRTRVADVDKFTEHVVYLCGKFRRRKLHMNCVQCTDLTNQTYGGFNKHRFSKHRFNTRVI